VMEVIDAQLHPVFPTSWDFDERSRVAASVELTREAMDSVGIDAALLHVDDLEFCDVAIQKYPARFAACVKQQPWQNDYRSVLQDLCQHRGVVATRAMVGNPFNPEQLSEGYLTGGFDGLFSAAEELSVPLFLFLPGFADVAGGIAAAYPSANIVVDHIGLRQPPGKVDNDPWRDLDSVISLAAFPNVSIKLSGAITLSREPFPFPDVWGALHRLLEAFGSRRLMWGSDMTRLRWDSNLKTAERSAWSGTYSDSLHFLRDTSQIGESEKADLFGGTLRRVLSWV
jgi:L-fuconolactonase